MLGDPGELGFAATAGVETGRESPWEQAVGSVRAAGGGGLASP